MKQPTNLSALRRFGSGYAQTALDCKLYRLRPVVLAQIFPDFADRRPCVNAVKIVWRGIRLALRSAEQTGQFEA
jgi:hypothetical protein